MTKRPWRLSILEWIGLIVAGVILLKTIASGGGWFEFLDGHARFENAMCNFKFNVFFFILCLALVGGAVWLFMKAGQPEITTRQAPAVHAKHSAVHQINKTHKKKAHHTN